MTIVGAGIIMDHEDTDHLGRALEILTTITTPAHAQDLAPPSRQRDSSMHAPPESIRLNTHQNPRHATTPRQECPAVLPKREPLESRLL